MAKIYRRWIYHATEKPFIINSDEFEGYSKKGWKDSPANFTKIEAFGVDKDDMTKVNALGEAIEGVKDRINGDLNVDIMTKKQLEEHARKHFNVELDRRKRIGDLRKQVKELS
jgi:hypothetical protein